MKKLKIKPGDYIWSAGHCDLLVKVVGYLGEMNGEHYVSIAGSSTGLPVSSLRPLEKECITPKEESLTTPSP